jgi:hypothetical protein
MVRPQKDGVFATIQAGEDGPGRRRSALAITLVLINLVCLIIARRMGAFGTGTAFRRL